MTETLLPFIEAVLVAGLGIWMTLAVYDNWRHPDLNRQAVRMVMQFDVMERDYPDDYAIIAHRRVNDLRLINIVFQMIRITETTAALALLSGSGLLFLSAADLINADIAGIVAIVGVTFFSMIWAGFIIGGNYFHYYYCHQWGQSNHFMFMYWGLFVLVVLLI
jgi:predicted small integral membrane protein